MTLAFHPSRYTYEDYCKLPDQPRMELIDGDFVLSPAPNTAHQRISGKIYVFLANFLKENPIGIAFAAPTDVVLSKHTTVQPDILYISNQRSSIITEANIQGAPDLVIEIISPGNTSRDTLLKKALYEKYGVQEYWIIEPNEKTIHGLLLEQGRYGSEKVYNIEEIIQSRIMPGLQIPLDQIFET